MTVLVGIQCFICSLERGIFCVGKESPIQLLCPGELGTENFSSHGLSLVPWEEIHFLEETNV